MDFFKSRSFFLAVISTAACMLVVTGYAYINNRSALLDDSFLIGTVFALFNFFLFYIIYSNNSTAQNLILTEDRLQFAMSASGEGIYDWDIKSGRIFYSDNFVNMLGYTQDDFGNDIAAFENCIHNDDQSMVRDTVMRFLNNQLSEYSVEFRMTHKEGHEIWINSCADAIRDNNGQAKRIIGTHRDITNQKIIEENLKDEIVIAEQSAEIKSDFLAHMSHEIRTPLTAITGIAEILEKNSGDFNDRQKELISTLLTSTKSLKELVTDILDFSKIEKGEIDFDEQYFPVTELTNEVISMMSVPANEKNIGFKVMDEDIRNIEYLGDKSRMRQILVNLIGNAIKFTDDGMVTLLIKKESIQDIEVLNFYVQDTGIGIDESSIKTIFEEFRQGDSSVSRKYGGTGLGLPISKNLAILMGGDISVESTKDLGSTFTLTLPLTDRVQDYKQDIDPTLKQKISDRLLATIRDEQTALIVEDYQGNVVILSYLMEEIGLPFDVAKNGEEAISMWSEKHYDIVLMDVQMPIMDGLTATSKIRDIETENGFNETPIIGMTAHALVEDKNKCIHAGMSDYLSKPIDSTKLKQKILQYIQKDNVVRIKKTATE